MNEDLKMLWIHAITLMFLVFLLLVEVGNLRARIKDLESRTQEGKQ